jgi:hypothetical protein
MIRGVRSPTSTFTSDFSSHLFVLAQLLISGESLLVAFLPMPPTLIPDIPALNNSLVAYRRVYGREFGPGESEGEGKGVHVFAGAR